VRESTGKSRTCRCLPKLVPQRTPVPHGIFSKCSGFLWYKVFQLVKLYLYLFAGSSSALVVDALVEGPDKDG
jgi:hypothetical protein